MGDKIRIAIVGVGNCASSLIQGIEFYKKNSNNSIGLLYPTIGGYKPSDIEVVAAFDIDARKVGKYLHEAIFAKPNCTLTFCDNLESRVKVEMGNVLDGCAEHMLSQPEDKTFVIANEPPVDVVKVLKESKAEILLNYLPVGSEEATVYYTEAALEAGVALINNIPVFIASNEFWQKKFEEKNLPLIGDDIKAQVGATIVHRVLAKLFNDRGVKIDRTYQLNIGGNTDFLNMLDRSRLKSKKLSKTEAVQSQFDFPLDEDNIYIGPSDYVPWLKDNKVCFIRLEGRGFGGAPIILDVRLSVEDSPNSAAMVMSAILCCKLALDRKIGGVLTSVSAYTMKHPPKQYSDTEAKELLEKFIKGQIER